MKLAPKEEPLIKRILEIGKDVKAKKAKARREKVKELMGSILILYQLYPLGDNVFH